MKISSDVSHYTAERGRLALRTGALHDSHVPEPFKLSSSRRPTMLLSGLLLLMLNLQLSHHAKGDREKKLSLFIEFPEEGEPWCIARFSDPRASYRYNCRGRIGEQYPPQATLFPPLHKHYGKRNPSTGKMMKYAIGPLDWRNTLYIHEGIVEEFHSTNGSIVLNRWDMKKLMTFFDRETVVAVQYEWWFR